MGTKIEKLWVTATSDELCRNSQKKWTNGCGWWGCGWWGNKVKLCATLCACVKENISKEVKIDVLIDR